MFKHLYRLILRSFIGPFFVTFFIALFVLMLQFVMKYLDDFVGKGLATQVIVELLTYAIVPFVLYALPMAILLSSLMTFGNLGEHYELVAMKSAGISLPRIMLPLFIITFFLSIGLFFYANIVIPKANLNFYSLLYDITQAKPAFQLTSGTFYNGIKDVSIQVRKVDNATNTLTDVLIYDHTANLGANKIIIAKQGKMEFTQDKNYLVMTLYNGWLHEELLPEPNKSKNSPHATTYFHKYTTLFDISSLQLNRTDKKLFLHSEKMKNNTQLQRMKDSLQKEIERMIKNAKDYFRPTFHYDSTLKKQNVEFNNNLSTKPIIQWFPKDKHNVVYRNAFNQAQGHRDYLVGYRNDIIEAKKRQVKAELEYHQKFALPVICIIFMGIGAPLGAIIRKGGLGLPTVVSTVFFILYWIISEWGRKMAIKKEIAALHGAWLGVYILLPMSILVIYLATTDANILDTTYYKSIFYKWIKGKRYLSTDRTEQKY
ncbi:MAG: LptF/LptG family permease [Bacteroidia bacterium]|nr:LptF/LptG family permease [Bacteroidia bacterium]MDW8346335.1 LptF/LptG family permease [Bacteroidia bacterium]